MKTRSNKASYFALSILAVAISQAVYAEDAQVLDEMVVSGSRTAENCQKRQRRSAW